MEVALPEEFEVFQGFLALFEHVGHREIYPGEMRRIPYIPSGRLIYAFDLGVNQHHIGGGVFGQVPRVGNRVFDIVRPLTHRRVLDVPPFDDVYVVVWRGEIQYIFVQGFARIDTDAYAGLHYIAEFG